MSLVRGIDVNMTAHIGHERCAVVAPAYLV